MRKSGGCPNKALAWGVALSTYLDACLEVGRTLLYTGGIECKGLQLLTGYCHGQDDDFCRSRGSKSRYEACFTNGMLTLC
jgi:hypothetical protein